MSAAEPAHPGPDGSGSTAAVIPIRHRAAVRLSKRRREATVPDTPDTSPHQRLADRIEELFLKHDRRTLTDPETAQVFLITLGLVTDMLEGARVNGLVGDDQHRELAALIEGMRAAPDLI